jgi:ribonuclease D
VREFRLVDNDQHLSEAIAGLADAAMIALDTEFVRERTYFAELCLIQFATEEVIACIDCISQLDLEPLFEVLFRDDVTWLLHSARQDLEVLSGAAGRLPANLIDTQIAAGLIGYPPQVGLQDIVEKRLGVKLEKGHTRTNWARRPLAEGAIDYALDDVRYLPALWSNLNVQLQELGREGWMSEDCRRALETPLVPDSAQLLTRVKGVGSLRGRALRVALSLTRWREERARAADKPRRWILADDALVAIARLEPQSPEALSDIASLPARAARRSGAAIIEAVAAADSEDIREAAEAAQPRTKPDPAALKALQKRVQVRADALGIPPEIIASRRDLTGLVLGEAPRHLLSGWRSKALGLA